MPTASNGEYDCREFNTDKMLYSALISANKAMVNNALYCLKQNFLKLYENAGHTNKWYADDCLMIAIGQFHKYLNDGKFTLGKTPVVAALYIFFKRRLADFDKKEFQKNKLRKEMAIAEENILEKIQKQKERKQITEAAVSRLRPNCQAILKMRYFDGLTIFQIAEARQLKPESLHVEMTRCKKELKTILIDKFKFPPHGLWV